MRDAILDEAKALTCGDRAEAYGPPVESFAHAAAIFNAREGMNLTARQIVVVMQSVKQARRAANPQHRDSYVDDAAYVAIEYECAMAEVR